MDQKTYEIKLDQNQLNVVISALQEMPFKVSAPVIDNIVQQIQAAEKAAQVVEG